MRPATPGWSVASFNEQRERIYKACLRRPQDKWISASTHQILKVDKEALAGFSHTHRVGVLNTTSLSQGWIPEAASGSGKGQWNPHQGEGVRSLRQLQSSSRVSWWSRLFDDLPQHPRLGASDATLPPWSHLPDEEGCGRPVLSQASH